ncbi:MAG TPA: hypothetical protein ENN03_04965 [bacterium]|nr:hypothetical protein [bacterium]
MSDIVTLYENPSLNKPSLIAAWPGMGSVAMMAVGYLKDKLGAKVLGEISPSGFFKPTGATVAKRVIQAPESPLNRFYYYQGKKDLLFFIGSSQPIPHKEYEFAMKIIKVAEMFDIEGVYTAAATPTDMFYKDKPRVFAVPNDVSLIKKLREFPVHFMDEGSIAGLNGLLISVARELDYQGLCLLGEIPFFTAQIEFPRASLVVLEVLCKWLDISLDMVDLELYSAKKEKEIAPLAALLTKDMPSESQEMSESIIPKSEDSVPQSVHKRIEELFKQAEYDQTYKSKMRLKEELDKWELFEDYLDRFLDLFTKGKGES